MSISLAPYFEDLDGDDLIYTVDAIPPGLSLDPNSGVFSGTFSTDGVYTITARATDPYGAFAEQTFDWSVAPAGFELIQYNYRDITYSPEQIAFIEAARTFWNSVLTQPLAPVTLVDGTPNYTQIKIDIRAIPIDGVGGGAAAVGTPTGFPRPGTGQTSSGAVTLDIDDLDNVTSNGYLDNLVIHEIGHVLGIGTTTDNAGIDLVSGGVYSGAKAVAEYSVLTGNPETTLPMEADGHHLNEATFGEMLMTPSGGFNPPVPRLIIAILEDLGYTGVNYAPADPYTLP
jgi:hypothetical protein